MASGLAFPRRTETGNATAAIGSFNGVQTSKDQEKEALA